MTYKCDFFFLFLKMINYSQQNDPPVAVGSVLDDRLPMNDWRLWYRLDTTNVRGRRVESTSCTQSV